jgi:hypothetical protein
MACSRFRITVSGFWSGGAQLVVGYEALNAWAATAAPCAAVVQLPDDMTLRAAVRLHKPARPTRLRDTIVRELPGRHVLVQRLPGSDDSALLVEIANLVDPAGGIAFVPDRTPTAAVEPADSHRLRVRGVSLDALLHARGRLAAEQQAAGVLRPLPRWASVGVMAARMPEPAPVQHACLSAAMLAAHITVKQERLLYALEKEGEGRTLDCPICWHNERLSTVKHGVVAAVLPALTSEGWGAGHLCVAHAEHGHAKALMELWDEPGLCPRRKNDRPVSIESDAPPSS